jgi:hypothetical protein
MYIIHNGQTNHIRNGLNVPNPIDPTETISTNVQGMGARHMGVELDFAIKLTKKLNASKDLHVYW